MVGPIFSKAKIDTFDKMTCGNPQYFLAQKFEGGRGTEIQLPNGLHIYALVIFEAWNDTFLIIRPPKSPSLGQNSLFDLLHHQVDTLGIVLSLNFRGLHKNKLPKVIEIDALVIFEAKNDNFLMKRLPKIPRFEKNIRNSIYWIGKKTFLALF